MCKLNQSSQQSLDCLRENLENLNRNPPYLLVKTMVSCKFSLEPIQSSLAHLTFDHRYVQERARRQRLAEELKGAKEQLRKVPVDVGDLFLNLQHPNICHYNHSHLYIYVVYVIPRYNQYRYKMIYVTNDMCIYI